MNTFGNTLRLTTFGESHGIAIGGVLDGFPSGVILSMNEVARQMARRRPGNSPLTSQRQESDKVEFLSGLMGLEGDTVVPLSSDTERAITLGTPIGFIIKNNDHRSADYDKLRDVYRPSHADLTTQLRYGIRDWRGGGRSSGRETACRVVAGALARQFLSSHGISIQANLISVGGETDPKIFHSVIEKAAAEKDSVGGIVECRVTGFFNGIGNPVYGKLQQQLAAAMLSIGGVKGFEYGNGFAISTMKGSEAADEMRATHSGIEFLSNHSGGIQGGISIGEEIVFRVAFKPTPTIGKPLRTVTSDNQNIILEASGRHDPCIAVRGVSVVEAMAALTLLDAALTTGISSKE